MLLLQSPKNDAGQAERSAQVLPGIKKNHEAYSYSFFYLPLTSYISPFTVFLVAISWSDDGGYSGILG